MERWRLTVANKHQCPWNLLKHEGKIFTSHTRVIQPFKVVRILSAYNSLLALLLSSLLGALQEALAIDVQKLSEKFFSYDKEIEDEQ